MAKTTGVFGLDDAEIGKLLKKLKPGSFEDIIALYGLYRPGPLGIGMVNDFIKGKHNKGSIKYAHPKLKPILQETYGVIAYQEQIMQIASNLAGLSLTDAGVLRKAFATKKTEIGRAHV